MLPICYSLGSFGGAVGCLPPARSVNALNAHIDILRGTKSVQDGVAGSLIPMFLAYHVRIQRIHNLTTYLVPLVPSDVPLGES